MERYPNGITQAHLDDVCVQELETFVEALEDNDPELKSMGYLTYASPQLLEGNQQPLLDAL